MTPCTVAHQPLLSMKFSRQEYWSELPFLTPGDFPDPRTEPLSPVSPALGGRFFTAEPCEKPIPSVCISWMQSTSFFLLNILNIGYTCGFLFIQCLYSITVISLCDAQIVPKLDGGNPFILVPMSCHTTPLIKCFFAFWANKKDFFPLGWSGSLFTFELISVFYLHFANQLYISSSYYIKKPKIDGYPYSYFNRCLANTWINDKSISVTCLLGDYLTHHTLNEI